MTRGKGEGSVFKSETTGLWNAIIELPPHHGQRRRRVKRSKEKRVVLEWLDKKRAELREKGDLPTTSLTVQQWFTYWLDQIVAPTVRPTTAAGYRGIVRTMIVPSLGANTKLEKVTPAMIRDVAAYVLEQGRSTSYANSAHRTMQNAFNVAQREGKIASNPVKLVKAPRIKRDPQEALTVEETEAFIEHIKKDPYGPIWATALFTGARRGEVLGIERDRIGDVLDLSWQLQHLAYKHGCGKKVAGADKYPCGMKRASFCDRRHLEAPNDFEYRHLKGNLYLTRPKTSRGWRIIPLVEPLRSIIELQLRVNPDNEYGLLFTDANGDPFDPNFISKRWQQTVKDAGIEKDMVMHGLRHTAADLLFLAGVPEDIIEEILGHSARVSRNIYKKRGNLTRLTAAMESMSAMLSLPAGSDSR